jgi:hypothetical protein
MEAMSKCPACRTVFPQGNGGMMEAALSYQFKRQMNDDFWLEVHFHAADKDLAEALEELRVVLNLMADEKETMYPSIEVFACDHIWTMKPGEHSTIGCGHF